MSPQSRPLRAVIIILCVWVSGRVGVLSYVHAVRAQNVRARTVATRNSPNVASVRSAAESAPGAESFVEMHFVYPMLWPHLKRSYAAPMDGQHHSEAITTPADRGVPLGGRQITLSNASIFADPVGALPPPAKPLWQSTPHSHRLTLSAWSVLRNSGTAGLNDAGQLGGSQAGLRAYYALGTARRISLTARLSAAMDGSAGKEAAVGIAIKPFAKLPLTVIVERRIALDSGGRNDFAVVAATGVYDRSLPLHFTLNGYAQAGVVGARKRDAFADGALEAEHPLVQAGRARLGLGGGVWGGAQPGLARVDAGPEAVLHVRLGAANLKAAASYRFRLAGNARPSSGPALSLGADF